MKCGQCGTKNDPKNKFCSECGIFLSEHSNSQPLTAIAELYGKEVEVLFFIENFTGKISGIVNPSEDQIGRYREGLLQKIIIESPVVNASDEEVGTIMTFIRESKDYLGESFTESNFSNLPLRELKKEYLKLFEKILKYKSKNQDLKPIPAAVPISDKPQKK
ncbi:MAG TPA: zinc ribbon domain-containing protein [bacterium]